jgi:cytochrome c553
MRGMIIAAVFMGLPALVAHAQDAGETTPAGAPDSVATCSACHGATGISVSDEIPNLAGQKAAYLAGQLRAFKDGTRQNDLMNAVAAQLQAEEIEALATFFSEQQVAAGAEKSELLPHLVREDFPFPDDYQSSFTKYTTINFPDRKQVRHYFANETALEAARAGEPLPDGSYILVEIHSVQLDDNGEPVMGDDGFYVADELTGFTAMAREPGWGDVVPELLRNENWNYSVFRQDRTVNTGANQAGCLACHQPHEDTSFLFTLDPLREVAREN